MSRPTISGSIYTNNSNADILIEHSESATIYRAITLHIVESIHIIASTYLVLNADNALTATSPYQNQCSIASHILNLLGQIKRFVYACMYVNLYFARNQTLFNQRGHFITLHWRHNDHGGVSNHQPHDYLLNRVFRRRSKKTPKLRVTGLCAGNSPGPVNSPHKWPVTRKTFPFDDVIMSILQTHLQGVWSDTC